MFSIEQISKEVTELHIQIDTFQERIEESERELAAQVGRV